MPEFTITGDVDPFLHVSLRRGESISCESDAMVMMEATLDLTGRMQGGFLQAMMRRLANGESVEPIPPFTGKLVLRDSVTLGPYFK